LAALILLGHSVTAPVNALGTHKPVLKSATDRANKSLVPPMKGLHICAKGKVFICFGNSNQSAVQLSAGSYGTYPLPVRGRFSKKKRSHLPSSKKKKISRCHEKKHSEIKLHVCCKCFVIVNNAVVMITGQCRYARVVSRWFLA
jgi:hypothetical protein